MEEYSVYINSETKTEDLYKIKDAIHEMYQMDNCSYEDGVKKVLNEICAAIRKSANIIVPIMFEEFDDKPESISDFHYKTRELTLRNGEIVYAAFTSKDELQKGPASSVTTENISHYLNRTLLNTEVDGLLIDPWGESIYLSKVLIESIFSNVIPEDRLSDIYIETVDITKTDIGAVVIPQLSHEEACFGDVMIQNDNPEIITMKILWPENYSENKTDVLNHCIWSCLEEARLQGVTHITFPAEIGKTEKEVETILHAVTDWTAVYSNRGMKIRFAADDDSVAETYRSIWDNNLHDWKKIYYLASQNKLDEAILFAVNCHKGQHRKGSDKPYILHPIETFQILASMNADNGLLIAGLLHDIIEDTDINMEDIYRKFGLDTAILLHANTEDKRQPWYVRKRITIDHVSNLSTREQMLILADKVSNLRSMYRDYLDVGDKLWTRFNAGKEFQAWYYSKINDGLYDLQNHINTKAVYWEMVDLYKDLFVQFMYDEEAELIYQIDAAGESVVLSKDNLEWKSLEGEISTKAIVVPRKFAERMEDNWTEEMMKVSSNEDKELLS